MSQREKVTVLFKGAKSRLCIVTDNIREIINTKICFLFLMTSNNLRILLCFVSVKFFRTISYLHWGCLIVNSNFRKTHWHIPSYGYVNNLEFFKNLKLNTL